MEYYALLSNAYTAALVDPTGSIDWLPVPRFDSAAVFCRVLDPGRGGFFRVYVQGGQVLDRRYMEGTLILSTLWKGADGLARLIDYLPIGHPEVRRLVLAGTAVNVELEPRFEYGQMTAAYETGPSGGVFENPRGTDALLFRIRSSGSVQQLSDHLWRLGPGRHELTLRYTLDKASDGLRLSREPAEPGENLRRQVHYWRSLPVPSYDGPLKEALDRSLLVLRGLTFRPNGAIIAAPTTSLPETPGEGRQWDYRFVWVRDGAYAIEALIRAGDFMAARRFLEFFLNTVELWPKPFPRPFFRVDGTPAIGEQELRWLSGYEGSRPVRAGNAATEQLQLDVEGDFLFALAEYVDATGDLAFLRYYERPLTAIVDWTATHWPMPDAGLWEFRGTPRRFTHSALMAWVGLSQGARLLTRLGRRRKPAQWLAEADLIRNTIESEAIDPVTGRYGQSFGDPSPDAALLLLPLYGYCSPHAPAFDRTLSAIESELTEGPFVYRYRQDDFGQARHPFLLASAWLARVYAARGERSRAYEILTDLWSQATPLGLLAEHADPASGRPLGNFPQLFSHVGLITALLELAQTAPPPAVAEDTSARRPVPTNMR